MSAHIRSSAAQPQQPSLGVLGVLRACSPWMQLLSNVVVGLVSLAVSPSNTVNYDVSAKTLSILLFVLLVVMVCLYVVCEDRRITEFLKNDLIVRIVVVIYAVLVYRSNTEVLKLDFLHLLIIFTHLIFIPVEFGRIRHNEDTKLRK